MKLIIQYGYINLLQQFYNPVKYNRFLYILLYTATWGIMAE